MVLCSLVSVYSYNSVITIFFLKILYLFNLNLLLMAYYNHPSYYLFYYCDAVTFFWTSDRRRRWLVINNPPPRVLTLESLPYMASQAWLATQATNDHVTSTTTPINRSSSDVLFYQNSAQITMCKCCNSVLENIQPSQRDMFNDAGPAINQHL